MAWVRIDNRLIHGQIIETWLPFTGAKTLVVANDELATDDMQQAIMTLGVPSGIEARFVSVEALCGVVDKGSGDPRTDTVVIFFGCADARRAFDSGFAFNHINIGNIHYGPGKRQLSPSVAVSDDDENSLRYFMRNGIELDFRCVPNDPVQVRF